MTMDRFLSLLFIFLGCILIMSIATDLVNFIND